MKSRLFWKTWGSLCLILILTYVLSMLLTTQLESVSETQQLRSRPWRAIESLALEAERIAESGGDLREWSSAQETNRLGDVYLLDPQGREINGRPLPVLLRRAALRPFSRQTPSAADAAPVHQPPGLARTVFVPGQEQPMTLIFIPRLDALGWRQDLPIIPVLVLVGLLISGCGAWLLSRHTVSPIRALNFASERVANGDFSVRVSGNLGSRKDEVADLAQRFDEMTRKLKAASTFQKSLFRDVSHELRSPLTRIQVAGELLAERSSDEMSPIAARLQREIVELECLIDEILTLSRLDHGPDAVHREFTDLVALVTDVVDDAAFTAESMDRAVALQHHLHYAPCMVDAKLIRRAVHNVIDNAVHHAPEGTVVQVTLENDADTYRIRVIDQGEGVPEAELDAIFQPFYRAAASSSQVQGSGVGLALVARIVQTHGGSVRAVNLREGGLAVTITLPVRRSE